MTIAQMCTGIVANILFKTLFIRANVFGWPNTYSFTKAMGEMNLREFNDQNIPIVIIRPTIISSTYKHPFPGWIEGLK